MDPSYYFIEPKCLSPLRQLAWAPGLPSNQPSHTFIHVMPSTGGTVSPLSASPNPPALPCRLSDMLPRGESGQGSKVGACPGTRDQMGIAKLVSVQEAEAGNHP